MKSWLILGASGHGRSLASVIRGRGDRIAAVGDRALSAEAGRTAAAEAFRNTDGSVPVMLDDDAPALDLALAESLSVTIAVGANGVRSRIAAGLLADERFSRLAGALVAASATVDATAVLGPLAQVCEHAHVGPLAQVGEAVIVNTGAIVEHDCRVGAGAHLAPGSVLLGAATVGREVFLGSGARVLPGIGVGDHAVLGAGAVATRQLDGMATYVGVPARRLTPTKGPAH
ncbi:transferase [Arthrobacter celericrescens]|uniref:PglD-related sugar-binding protein n=1 Tax=Arthrobacter celericrescens TaxID=2320851 RepID=UPI000EA1000F|nr:transferase [Arthrobacter celericrescens]